MQDYKEDKEETKILKRMLENILDGHPYWTLDQWCENLRSARYPLIDPNKGSEQIEKDTIDIFWEGAGFYPFG